jgi:hypothetical protein
VSGRGQVCENIKALMEVGADGEQEELTVSRSLSVGTKTGRSTINHQIGQ